METQKCLTHPPGHLVTQTMIANKNHSFYLVTAIISLSSFKISGPRGISAFAWCPWLLNNLIKNFSFSISSSSKSVPIAWVSPNMSRDERADILESRFKLSPWCYKCMTLLYSTKRLETPSHCIFCWFKLFEQKIELSLHPPYLEFWSFRVGQGLGLPPVEAWLLCDFDSNWAQPKVLRTSPLSFLGLI